MDLFARPLEPISPGAILLRNFVTNEAEILAALAQIAQAAPHRHMLTPWGKPMSVAMTNTGTYGWTTSRTGYRYTREDPETGTPWPPMPEALTQLATQAAQAAGYPDFHPDSCLINRYAPGARMTPHQDRNEQDFTAPIVSISLGLPATFLWGGPNRTDPTRKVPLNHGDAIVWGGPARLHFHGIAPLKDGTHPTLGRQRLNLTFRKAGP